MIKERLGESMLLAGNDPSSYSKINSVVASPIYDGGFF